MKKKYIIKEIFFLNLVLKIFFNISKIFSLFLKVKSDMYPLMPLNDLRIEFLPPPIF